jgi:hypothetical protein
MNMNQTLKDKLQKEAESILGPKTDREKRSERLETIFIAIWFAITIPLCFIAELYHSAKKKK